MECARQVKARRLTGQAALVSLGGGVRSDIAIDFPTAVWSNCISTLATRSYDNERAS
jgi:hypothetical protein